MLVGRDAERRRIDALLAEARLGQGGALVISGEAGIGKTTLLEDARARATGIRVLTVTGTVTERDLPFAGLAQLLRIQTSDLDRLPAPQAEALGVALALRQGGGVDRFAVGAGLLSLLAQQSEETPLCLLVDDAHQLDLPSQDALLFVARRLLADSICLLIAYRSGEPCRLADPGLPTMTLSGIDESATRELVRAEGGGRAGRIVDQVIALALGNPLAIRELVADPDALVDQPIGLPRTLPTTLTDAYARRAAELSPDGLLSARCAAVAGEDLAVIAQMCHGLGVSVSTLDEAETAGLLRTDGGHVRFRHPLIRSALSADAPGTLRRQLHAAAARAIGDGDPDRSAWHASEATLGPDRAVAEQMDEVASRAARRSAYATAAHAAERAAELSAAGAERGRRMVLAGTWAWRAGDVERASRLLRDALAQQPAADVHARALRALGVIAARSGAIDHARDTLVRAAEVAPDATDALVDLAEAVDACFYLGDSVTAVALAERIERILTSTDVDPDARAQGSIAAGCARVLVGQDGTGLIRDGLRRITVDDPDHDPTLATWAVLGVLFVRDTRTGRELIQRIVDGRRARSAIGELPHLLFHVARDEATRDQWDRAEADYGEAIALARELGQSTELAASLAGLAWLEARRGRAAETTAHAEESLALCAEHRIRAMEVWARLALADLAHARGEIETALDRYLRLAALLDRWEIGDPDLSPAPEIVECRLRLGRAGPAVEQTAAAYASAAAAKGQPWALARAARTTALLAGDDEIDAAFTRALGFHSSTLDQFERARTHLAYGGRLRRSRRRIDARAQLEPALESFIRLGARPWADLAADELAATGATVTRPDDSPTSRLTPRELQIAMLLTEGRTTKETAGALFLSPKTVEYHLRNIYTKLDISSRVELAALISPAP